MDPRYWQRKKTVKDCTDALNELYGKIYLDSAEEAKARLIRRYPNKVSQRLLNELERIEKEAQQRAKDQWREMLGFFSKLALDENPKHDENSLLYKYRPYVIVN